MTDTIYLIFIIVILLLIYYYNNLNNPYEIIDVQEDFDHLSDKKNTTNINENVDINKPIEINNASYGDNYFIDIGEPGLSLSNAMCSKSCCSPQYPIPFSLPTDKMVCESNEKYVPSGITCNNGWQDTGCLCMTEKQAVFLATRGQNA